MKTSPNCPKMCPKTHMSPCFWQVKIKNHYQMILFLAWQYRPPISYKSLFGFKTKSLNQIKNVQKTKYDLMVLYMLRPILPCHKQESTAWSTMRMWPTNDNVASTQKLHYHININLTLYSYHNVILATPFNVNMEVALYKEGDTIGVGTFTSHFFPKPCWWENL